MNKRLTSTECVSLIRAYVRTNTGETVRVEANNGGAFTIHYGTDDAEHFPNFESCETYFAFLYRICFVPVTPS